MFKIPHGILRGPADIFTPNRPDPQTEISTRAASTAGGKRFAPTLVFRAPSLGGFAAVCTVSAARRGTPADTGPAPPRRPGGSPPPPSPRPRRRSPASSPLLEGNRLQWVRTQGEQRAPDPGTPPGTHTHTHTHTHTQTHDRVQGLLPAGAHSLGEHTHTHTHTHTQTFGPQAQFSQLFAGQSFHLKLDL